LNQDGWLCRRSFLPAARSEKGTGEAQKSRQLLSMELAAIVFQVWITPGLNFSTSGLRAVA
jgi:hypothetical protein